MAYISKAVAPTININGSSAGSLLNEQLDVLTALRNARTLMQRAMPHGRDYQTAQPSDYKVARDEANARILLIDQLIADHELIALAISEQRR